LNLDSMRGRNVLIAGGAGLLGISMTKRLVSLEVPVKSTYFHRKPPEQLRRYFTDTILRDLKTALLLLRVRIM